VYQYDLLGQLTKAVFTSTNATISNQVSNYFYDAMGNRTVTVINGVTTEYTTNSLNQYLKSGTRQFTYDLGGNLVASNDENGSTSFSYNAKNQLVMVSNVNDAVVYEYDALGQRTSTLDNGVRAEQVWDPLGLGNVVTQYNSDATIDRNYFHGLKLAAFNSNQQRYFLDFDAIGSTSGVTGESGSELNHYTYSPFGGKLFDLYDWNQAALLKVMENWHSVSHSFTRLFNTTHANALRAWEPSGDQLIPFFF
jgi:YD repeat-containing protein